MWQCEICGKPTDDQEHGHDSREPGVPAWLEAHGLEVCAGGRVRSLRRTDGTRVDRVESVDADDWRLAKLEDDTDGLEPLEEEERQNEESLDDRIDRQEQEGQLAQLAGQLAGRSEFYVVPGLRLLELRQRVQLGQATTAERSALWQLEHEQQNAGEALGRELQVMAPREHAAQMAAEREEATAQDKRERWERTVAELREVLDRKPGDSGFPALSDPSRRTLEALTRGVIEDWPRLAVALADLLCNPRPPCLTSLWISLFRRLPCDPWR